jgi:hypothetical protein
MNDLAFNAAEIPVPGPNGPETTDAHCENLGAGNYTIDGKPISLPVKVDAASMLMNIFTVNTKQVDALLEGTGFKPVELWPGKALMQLLGVDYQQNDLGDYNEAAIIFPVTTPGEKAVRVPLLGAMTRMARSQLSNYVYRMPVNQNFTTHAGRYIWGFPKWVTQVDFEMDEQWAKATFTDNGQLVFSISAAAGGKTEVPGQDAPSLAIRNGMAWRTIGRTEGEGLRFKLGGPKPVIGDQHPLAKLLRELGLPKRPLCTVSMKKAVMSFDHPECVALGQAFPAS